MRRDYKKLCDQWKMQTNLSSLSCSRTVEEDITNLSCPCYVDCHNKTPAGGCDSSFCSKVSWFLMCWLIRGNNTQFMFKAHHCSTQSHVKWKRCLWLQSCNCKPFLTTFCAVCVLVTVCSGVLQLHWLMHLFTSYWGRSAESIFVWMVRLNFGSSLLKWITQYIERLFTYIDDLHLFQLPQANLDSLSSFSRNIKPCRASHCFQSCRTSLWHLWIHFVWPTGEWSNFSHPPRGVLMDSDLETDEAIELSCVTWRIIMLKASFRRWDRSHKGMHLVSSNPQNWLWV